MQICSHCGCGLSGQGLISYGNVGSTNDGEILFEGRRVELTRTLQEIVTALITARGRALSRSFLSDWLNGDISDEAIVKSVERVRRSFRKLDPAFDQLETVRGFAAYRWTYRPSAEHHPAPLV